MSITTELQRISQAKADLKSAFESKEITIDTDATLDSYVSKVDEVYTKGYEKGKAEGGSDGWGASYWNARLNGGNPCDCAYAFYGSMWNEETVKPPYNVIPTNATYMFYGSRLTDLVSHFANLGKTLDFSQCANFQWLIYGSAITHLGVVDMTKVSSASNANNVFRQGGGDSLQKIDKVIVSEKYPLGATAFGNCTQLTDIDIEGTITGTFTVTSSFKLNVTSAKNILTHLANYAGTDKEFTQSVKLHANVWALLDAEGETAPNGGTWVNYVESIGWLT